MTVYQPKRVIYLEPDCPVCGPPQNSEGRLWCDDNVWETCDGCGADLEAHRYVLDDGQAVHVTV